MGPGLGTNNEQLIGTLSSSALGQTHQYKQGLLRGAFSNHICQNKLNTLHMILISHCFYSKHKILFFLKTVFGSSNKFDM